MPITDIAPIIPLIHLHEGELCIVHVWKRKDGILSMKTNYSKNQSCLKALERKFGTAIESFPLPTLATSSLLFIKTLTQSEKYTDRIKKRGWGRKVWIRKKRKDRRKRKSATCLFCSYCCFSFKVQFVAQILWYSTVFKFWLDQRWHDKLQQGRGGVVPVRSDWLKGFLVKHDIT